MRLQRRGRQNNLANMLARLHEPVCRGRLRERKRSVHDGLDAAAFEERPHLTAQRRRNASLLFDAARTQCRAGDRQAPAQHLVEIDGG